MAQRHGSCSGKEECMRFSLRLKGKLPDFYSQPTGSPLPFPVGVMVQCMGIPSHWRLLGDKGLFCQPKMA